jgi:hypothetical protein
MLMSGNCGNYKQWYTTCGGGGGGGVSTSMVNATTMQLLAVMHTIKLGRSLATSEPPLKIPEYCH